MMTIPIDPEDPFYRAATSRGVPRAQCDRRQG